MKKLLFIALFCTCSLAGMSQNRVTIDGVDYLLEATTLGEQTTYTATIARQDKALSGEIIIPPAIEYEGQAYNVTGMVKPTLCDVYADATVEVEGGAFQGCKITAVTLPSSISVVEAGAFSACASLTSVTLPEGLTQIGAAAFSRCASLASISIPSTVTDLGSNTDYGYASFAFGDCSRLTSVNIPDGVTKLGCGCFRGTAITELTIPSSVSEMDGYCLAIPALKKLTVNVRDHRTLTCSGELFGTGDKLIDVTGVDLIVPNGSYDIYNTYEPWMNFKSITMLEGEEVVIESDQLHIVVDNVKYLIKGTQEMGYHAILKRQDATLSGEIIIPGNVPYSGTTYPLWSIIEPSTGGAVDGGFYNTVGGAFQGTKITKITLPSVTSIPAGTFADCTELKEVVLTEGTETIGAACFANCTQLKTVNIPTSVKDLGCETDYGYQSYVFGNCTSLKAIDIPAGVTRLANGVFKGSGIENLVIPAGVTEIGECALEMPQLKTLTLMQPDKEKFTVSGNAFGTDYSLLQQTDLIVPLGSAQVYSEYYPWLRFRSITDVNCYYLKLNGSVFSAPANIFSVDDETVGFERHDATFDEAYTQGLCIDTDTKVKFTTTTPSSWVYAYIFCSNSSKIAIDGEEIDEIFEDQCEQYSYYRYNKLVEAGEHTITCLGYEGNTVPCMFLLRVEDASASERFEPDIITTRIDNVRYILKETAVGEEVTRTATVGRQNTSLSGDIVIPASVVYQEKEYPVTGMVEPATAERFADETVEIVDGAFQGTAITTISLPATITRIPNGAFFECRQLSTVTLPEGLTQISAAAFARCESLEELFIPEAVTDLGGDTDYGYASYVFGGCTSLKKVNIPAGVTTLAGGLFKDSGLETFLIPATVTTLEPNSFRAQNLREFKLCHSAVNQLAYTESVFKDVDLSTVTLYVPAGAKNTFKDEYPWKDFADIIEYADQQDEHQYNAYRVAYTEELLGSGNAGARRRTKAAADEAVTLDYIPSGVPMKLKEDNVKDGYALVRWENAPNGNTMPASDIQLKGVFARMGDVNGDGKVTPADAIMILYHYFNVTQNGFLEKAANLNGDESITPADAIEALYLYFGSSNSSARAKLLMQESTRVPE
ncbi:MAG: leucine-rich repeat protein [Prevotella sp.]|nr:leucine-rich repeat protein [Prevotella sp.]